VFDLSIIIEQQNLLKQKIVNFLSAPKLCLVTEAMVNPVAVRSRTPQNAQNHQLYHICRTQPVPSGPVLVFGQNTLSAVPSFELLACVILDRVCKIKSFSIEIPYSD
jgi:hypothetical protein